MKIAGNLRKVERFWAVEIPLLLIHTQGRTRKEALEMAQDAVEAMVDHKSFKAVITPSEEDAFMVGSNDEKALMATVLRQQRASRGLSIRDVAQRLGQSSPNSYGRYESGDTKLSMEKFTELLHAIDAQAEPVLSIVRKRA